MMREILKVGKLILFLSKKLQNGYLHGSVNVDFFLAITKLSPTTYMGESNKLKLSGKTNEWKWGYLIFPLYKLYWGQWLFL